MNTIQPPDEQRAELYETMSPQADKLLAPDGSIASRNGNIVQPPDPERAAMYESMMPQAAKYLLPDGSITSEIGGGGSGGSGNGSGEETQIVTGIMTENGTMTLGWQPKAVFVFATTLSSSARAGNNTTSPTLPASMAIAMAFPGCPQLSDNNGTQSLAVNETGFTTNNLVGRHVITGNSAPDAGNPLRYVAFR